MNDLTQNIVAAASVFSAAVVLIGAVFAAYRWYLKQNKQDKDIADIKAEQTILTRGVLACLKGLLEQGCDGPVSEAVEDIEKHLNRKAHE